MKNRICIVLEGGCFSAIIADDPSGLEVTLLEYDDEGNILVNGDPAFVSDVPVVQAESSFLSDLENKR